MAKNTVHHDRMREPQLNKSGTGGAHSQPITQYFNSPVEQEQLEYKDKFPEDLPTMEEVKEKYGKVVWCKYTKCQFNKEVKGLQRTTGTILKNRNYTPISEKEHIWTNICTKDEIAIKFDNITTSSGSKQKVPSCFSAVTGTSGHMDWSKLLQSDGTPFGGNIDSQHATVDKSFEGYIG